MNLGNTSDWVVVTIAQIGPTELFVPESMGAAESGGLMRWALWGLVLLLSMVIVVWMRGLKQQRVDSRELAFRSLSRKLGLSSKEASALRAIAERDGVHPVGVLMSPSAVHANLSS